MYAVPAMLSGILPSEDQAAIAADHPDNLFTLLGDTYDLDVTESVTRLCPGSLCAYDDFTGAGLRGLLADARDVMEARVRPDADVEITAGFVEEVAGETPEGNDAARLDKDTAANHPARFASMLEELDELDDDPTVLHYLHLLLPHVPFRYLEDGTSYEEFDPDYGRFVGVWYLPEVAALARQRHLLQAMYTDRLLGELVATLQSQGTYDDVTLVVAVDHGISFTPDQSSRGRSDRTSNRSAWRASSCTSRSS